jgi:cyclic pyranopterin phosphate synthase
VTALRISLTDRCNFRCVYCAPPGGLSPIPADRFLPLESLARLVRLTASLGVRRYRLTGGEPLLRADVVPLVGALRGIEGVHELSMTTNGSLLARFAQPLRAAGLDRINVSLDSLDPARFAQVSGSRSYERVRAGVEAAVAAGFPVKINVVVLRDTPEAEILAFAGMAASGCIEVRFLEFMPLCGSAWEKERVYPIPDVRAVVARHFVMEELPRGDAPARTYTIGTGGGRVGFIAPLSEPFCATCSRIRLTADGHLRPCLFSDYSVDLGRLMRAGASDEDLTRAIGIAVRNKPRGSMFNDVPLARMGDAVAVSVSGPPIRAIGG